MIRFDKTQVQRVLISRSRFLGDVILTTPLIAALRQALPQAQLAYLTEEAFAPVLKHHPHLDEVIAFSRQWSIAQQFRFYHRLRRQRFDLAIDLFGNPRTALMTWLTGARFRVGGDHRGRRGFYNLRVASPKRDIDAVAHHLLCLEVLGLPSEKTQPRVVVSAAEQAEAESALRTIGVDTVQPLVGLHPGASWPNKRWPVRHFAEVAQRLAAQGVQVIVTQATSEQALAAELQRLAPGVRLVPVVPLRTIAAILSLLSVYVSNDCGVMHLAAGLGTPTIGLFGPSPPGIWFPYERNAGHQALFFKIACRPCHQNYCPLGHLDCQERLDPEVVTAAVIERLELSEMSKSTQ